MYIYIIYIYMCVCAFPCFCLRFSADPEKTKNIQLVDSIPSGSPVGRKVSSAYCTESYFNIYIYKYITCQSPCKPHVTILWECPITA